MRVLQIHNYYRFYGGECGVVDSEKRLLQSRGHDVVQYALDNKGIRSSVLQNVVAAARIPYNRQRFREVSLVVARERPDVAHVHNVFPLLSPSVYVALRSCGVPVVQSIHNYRFLCPNGLFFTHGTLCEDCIARGYFSAVRKRCVHDSFALSMLYASAMGLAWQSGNLPNNIDRYIAPSQFIADKLVSRGVPASRVRVCPHFVTEAATAPAPKQPYLLYLGRLSAEKGLWTLLKAMPEKAGLTLKIAGRGPLERALTAFAAASKPSAVEFLGFVDGKAKERLIRGALCTVVPSECYESFSVVAAESLCLGTPVIASGMGGLPEMIDHGKTGLLFDAGDVDGLRACILELVEMETSSLDTMAKQAIHSAAARFGPDVHYRRLLRIYQEARDSHATQDAIRDVR